MFSKILSVFKGTKVSVSNRNVTMEDIMIDISNKFTQDECLIIYRKHIQAHNGLRSVRLAITELAEKLGYNRFTVSKLLEEYLQNDENDRKLFFLLNSLIGK